MVDYVADLKQRQFIVADRNVSMIQLQVIGNIKDNIRIGVIGAEVRTNGSLVVNLSSEQALALGKELMNLARKGRFILS